jgi:hypothetical protein
MRSREPKRVRFIDVPKNSKTEFYQPVKCGVVQLGLLKE